jgi:hypothetical protein
VLLDVLVAESAAHGLALVDEAEHRQHAVELLVEGTGAVPADAGAQVAQAAGQLERKLDAGQVEPALLDQVLHLAQALDVAVGVESQVAGGARGGDQPFALVLPQRLRVHLQEAGRDADHEERLAVARCHAVVSPLVSEGV